MNYIKHLPLALFTCFCLKYLIISPTYQEILGLFIMGMVAGFFEKEIIHNRFKMLEEKTNATEKLLKEKLKDIDELKSGLVGIKLSQGMRTTKIG